MKSSKMKVKITFIETISKLCRVVKCSVYLHTGDPSLKAEAGDSAKLTVWL